MTCIVAVTDGTTVVMGADSRITYGWQPMELDRSSGKIQRVGEMMIGISGSVRFAQIIHLCFVPPPHEDGLPAMTYLARDVSPALRTCLRDHGWLHSDSGLESNGGDDHGSHALIGYRGHLYRLQSDFSFVEHAAGYDAIGSGSDIAIGALYVAQINLPRMFSRTNQAHVQIALNAAAQFNSSVGGPFVIEEQAA